MWAPWGEEVEEEASSLRRLETEIPGWNKWAQSNRKRMIISTELALLAIKPRIILHSLLRKDTEDTEEEEVAVEFLDDYIYPASS